MLIYCPKCEHACLDGHDTCPRCGHALRYKVEKIDNLIDQSAAQPRSASTELAEALKLANEKPRLCRELQPGYTDWISKLFITVGEIVALLGIVVVVIVGVMALSVAVGGTTSKQWGLMAFVVGNLVYIVISAVVIVMQGGMLIMAGRAYELLHDIAANTRQPPARS